MLGTKDLRERGRVGRGAILAWSALLAFAVALLIGVVPAHAQITYVHDDDIWVMNDDGGAPRALVDNTPLGMSSLSAPHPSLDGQTIYFSGSTSLYSNRNPQTGYVASGFWAIGAYRWTAAGPIRLSPAPAICPSYCSTFDTDAAPTAAGSFASVESLYGEGSSDSRISVGDPASTVNTACEPYSAAPDPANATLYAYVCDDGEPTVKVASGNPSSETTARTTSGIGYAYGLSTPAWRSDGGRIALAEDSAIAESTQPAQIATFNPDGSDPRIVLKSSDPAIGFDSPTFVGSDRIAFTAVQEVAEGDDPTDVWTVPASCVGCSFPASATRITVGGTSGDPAYTPGTVPQSLPAPSPSGTPTPTPAPAPAPAPKKPAFPVTAAKALTKKAAPGSGLAVQLSLSSPATVRLDVAKLAGKKPKPLGSVTRKLKKGTSTVRLAKVGKKRLAKGRYRIGVKVPGTEGTLVLVARAR